MWLSDFEVIESMLMKYLYGCKSLNFYVKDCMF